MTYVELGKILTLISNSYPGKLKYPTGIEEDDEIFEETWYEYLGDYPYEVVRAVSRKYAINNPKWPPNVGELVQEIEKFRKPKEEKLTAGEAWEMILSAIRKHGVLHGTKKAEASLPRKVIKAANCVGGLRNIGMSDENDTYFMNQFCKVYNDVSQAIDMDERLPEKIRKETAQLAAKFSGNIPQLNSGNKEAG